VAAIQMRIEWSASYTVRSQFATGTWTGTVDVLTVTNAMDPARSWVIQARASADALRHEQGHFNLNEVYRRKLELALEGLQSEGTTGQEAQQRLDELLHETASAVLDRLTDMQAHYDQETVHGTDSVHQAYWDQQIATWLLNPAAAP
jgi:predicted secreted Zn-dependent protease